MTTIFSTQRRAAGYKPRTPDSGINIKIADNAVELEDIYRFRYKIYIEQMHKKKQKYADHINKRIEEPLDKNACNVGVWVHGKLAACIRVNFGDQSDFGIYRELWSMDKVKGFSMERTCMCSKLMVEEHYRNSRINVMLQQFCYHLGLQHGMRHCFIESRDSLLEYYRKFGFIPYTERIVHDEYGEITPLVLKGYDIDYLSSLRSPFVAIFHEFVSENEVCLVA